MKFDLESARQEFRRLVVGQRNSQEMIQLLLDMRENADLDPNDMGWVLWNICDWYAVKKDAASQFRYHPEFFDLVKASFPERAHWVVCDGTQGLTLTYVGGYGDIWLEWYRYANENAPKTAENRTIRFEAHRANAGFCKSALDDMALLLQEDPNWANRDFATVTYMTQRAENYFTAGETQKVEDLTERLVEYLDDWLARVGDPQPVQPSADHLSGSWEAHNGDRSPSAVYIGVHNAACTFTKMGLYSAAERLFRIRWERGRMPTAYGEALFLLSCWRNRGDKDEIIRLHSQCTRLSPDSLKQFAPEVAEIVRP